MKLVTLFVGIFCCQLALADSDWVRFELNQGHILLPVSVKGIPTKAVLDSGAQVNGINSGFMEKHKLRFPSDGKLTIQGLFERKEVQTLTAIPTRILGKSRNLNKVAKIDLPTHNIGLVLGVSFFKNHIVQIDYPRQRLRLVSRTPSNIRKVKSLKAKSLSGSGELIVNVEVTANKRLWLLLDTGSQGGLLLERNAASDLGWLTKYKQNKTVSTGVNESIPSVYFWVDSMTLGKTKLDQVLVHVPAKNSGFSTQNEQVSGILGNDVLQHFILTLDYKSGKAHVDFP